MRCALWLRVSTADQHATDQAPALCRQFAERAGYTVACTCRLDGVSASTGAQRADIDRAVRDGWAGEFSVLVVWALDRLSRGGVEETFAIIRRFKEAGVTVGSVQEAWCGTGAAGDLMMAIAAWMAEQETARRSERINAGLQRRASSGLPVGRQSGARDKRPRKRSGYFSYWEAIPAGADVGQGRVRR